MLISTRRSAMVALILIPALFSSCGPETGSTPANTRAADEEAIRAADLAWSRTAQAGDLEAIVSYYTDDVVVLPPNAPAVVGKEAARELNRAMLAIQISVSWEPEAVEVASSGDMGYARGTYQLTFTGLSGTPVTDRGKYVEIWKKQPDGSWKVAVEALNSDLPPTSTTP